jgi:hypothetical protein
MYCKPDKEMSSFILYFSYYVQYDILSPGFAHSAIGYAYHVFGPRNYCM